MALGKLRIPLNRRQYFVVTGGPFMDCPPTMKGVKMAAEIRIACAVDIPTRDFQTPNATVMAKGLDKALDLILAGEPVYVGCFGGKGRTGLFLAVLAKAFGVRKPVEYVRASYYPHAVETADQYTFVEEFQISQEMRNKIRRAKRKYGWRIWRFNLTRMPVDRATFAKAWRRNDA